VVVGSIDDDDVDVGFPQRFGCEESAETGADDHDAVAPA
jgi:hypothetical protein